MVSEDILILSYFISSLYGISEIYTYLKIKLLKKRLSALICQITVVIIIH